MNETDAINKLRELAAKAGSQAALAKEAGVSQAYVSDVLTGKRPPSGKLLSVIGLQWKIVEAGK